MLKFKTGDKVLFVDFDGTITTGIISSFFVTKSQYISYNSMLKITYREGSEVRRSKDVVLKKEPNARVKLRKRQIGILETLSKTVKKEIKRKSKYIDERLEYMASIERKVERLKNKT